LRQPVCIGGGGLPRPDLVLGNDCGLGEGLGFGNGSVFEDECAFGAGWRAEYLLEVWSWVESNFGRVSC
jgi:hypothetical protein